ncbi:MAG: TVP38/TMEM64 family protein [Desulfobacterales bacterium]|nr:TVP38/TMEM64 family protein [Desulfobacterales bacterium]
MTSATGKKIGLIVLLLLAAGAFVYFDVGRFLTLEYIKASQERFQQLYSEHRFTVIAIYMLVYIAVTALSLPGAAVMTLAGGGFFGLVTGTIVVSFASTIGAACACLAARFVLRDWVQGKFGDRLTAINQGIEREGAFYLFSLRLIPVFPFFVINLLMGLTTMPIRTYFWVSQLGMLPATIVYVNAGKELGKIDSLSGIASPGLIASFVILGLFPLTVKQLMAFYKRRYGAQAGRD